MESLLTHYERKNGARRKTPCLLGKGNVDLPSMASSFFQLFGCEPLLLNELQAVPNTWSKHKDSLLAGVTDPISRARRTAEEGAALLLFSPSVVLFGTVIIVLLLNKVISTRTALIASFVGILVALLLSYLVVTYLLSTAETALSGARDQLAANWQKQKNSIFQTFISEFLQQRDKTCPGQFPRATCSSTPPCSASQGSQ